MYKRVWDWFAGDGVNHRTAKVYRIVRRRGPRSLREERSEKTSEQQER